MSEWKRYKLNDIASLSNGINFDKSAYTSGVKLIGVSDFKNRIHPDYDSLQEVDSKVVRSGDYLEKGDIVFVRSNGNKELVGRCMMIDRDIPVTYSGFCIKLRLKDKKLFDPVFFNYLFRMRQFKKSMTGTAVGANIQNLSQSRLGNCEVNVPDIETQKKIATILSRYDSLIENYQKQIKLLEESAQRLYKEWFVDLHFPGHENTKIVDGVPEGWELKSVTNNHLFDVAKCRIALFNGNKTYYATADVEGTYFCNSGVKIEYDNKPSRAQIQPSLYSVWFARMSNSFKIVGFIEQNNNRREDSILSSGFAGFESHYERFGFLYCLISSQWFNDQKDRYATGATQVSITNEGLSRIKCLLPTTRLAEEFSLVTNKIIEETILYRENCTMLTEARDRLLPKLMSGEMLA